MSDYASGLMRGSPAVRETDGRVVYFAYDLRCYTPVRRRASERASFPDLEVERKK